ncbi:MAG: damage-inducible protein DinB [Aquabacterium sp.]|uniref:DinB family protein n=1 Tax=Aquabacterium sp. TaxID=1872578 RepID=UPI0025BD5C81|nr:DinB family protein [Aquabacterium sp.]MBI5924955.1 damage-inducible protein DinB [Aquabacterium sp.]
MSDTPHSWNLRDYAVGMAHYNRWMNGKLYDAAATLSDEQRKADRGAFFKSVHGTLNHLLLGDGAWLQRMQGQAVTMTSPSQELHEDFDTLRTAREAMDQALLDWAASLTAVEATCSFSFFSVVYQKQITMPYVAAVMQIFNHQTHHRGQITTLLSQFGVDVGVTDIPLMPHWHEVYTAASS